jgi:hypothetical protein
MSSKSAADSSLIPPRAAQPAGEAETFDLAQVERVLGRAAAMSLEASTSRMTIDEIAQVAAEVGIDRSFVTRAVRELEPELASPARRAGMIARLVRRRWLDRALDRPALERVLARLDAFFGAHGKKTVHDDSASWSARHIHVTFEPEGDGTLVQISERFVNTASGLAAMGGVGGGTAGLAIGAIVLKGLALGPIVLLPAIAIGSGVGLWLARRRHAFLVSEADRHFTEALDSIERTLSATPRALSAGTDDTDE